MNWLAWLTGEEAEPPEPASRYTGMTDTQLADHANNGLVGQGSVVWAMFLLRRSNERLTRWLIRLTRTLVLLTAALVLFTLVLAVEGLLTLRR